MPSLDSGEGSGGVGARTNLRNVLPRLLLPTSLPTTTSQGSTEALKRVQRPKTYSGFSTSGRLHMDHEINPKPPMDHEMGLGFRV